MGNDSSLFCKRIFIKLHSILLTVGRRLVLLVGVLFRCFPFHHHSHLHKTPCLFTVFFTCAYVITDARHSLRPKIHCYSVWAGPNIIYMRKSLSTLSKNTLKATIFFVAVVRVNIGMTFYRGARLYMEERLYTHPLFELARSDTSRVVDRNGASTRLGKTTKLFKYLL